MVRPSLRALAILTASLLAAIPASGGHAHADPRPAPAYSCKIPPAGTKLTVSLAPDTSVRDLGTWVAGFTCKNVVFATDVAKLATKVTIIAPTALTPKQAVELFVDALEAAGLEVSQRARTFVVKRGPRMPAGCPDIATAPATAPGGDVRDPWTVTAEAPASEPPPPTADQLARGIKRISATEVHLSRDLLDKLIVNPAGFATGARVMPAVRDSKPIGFKLYAIRLDSLYGRLGLLDGDLISAINGLDLTSPEKALEAFAQLPSTSRLEVALVRQGKPVTLVIVIKPR